MLGPCINLSFHSRTSRTSGRRPIGSSVEPRSIDAELGVEPMSQTGSEIDREDVSGEVTATAAAMLPVLVRDLSRLGGQLDVHNVDEDSWTGTLRTLHTLDALQKCRLIAVAGAQGAGKTTLVRGL